MALPLTASWIAFVSCALILGLSTICLIGTEVAKEEINRIDEAVEKKVLYIKSLQIYVEMLARTETNSDTKAAILALAEKIRFSDPMSNEILADIETEILNKIKELKNAKNKAEIITVINVLLTERNEKIKILK